MFVPRMGRIAQLAVLPALIKAATPDDADILNSTCPGRSCPSGPETGSTGHDHQDLVLHLKSKPRGPTNGV
jgi:hypothetical protein